MRGLVKKRVFARAGTALRPGLDLSAFLSLLQQARRSTDRALREKWDRSLPFADTLFDRWERARELGFGAGASVYDSAVFIGDVSVGAETWIGPQTLLDGSGGGLEIGDHCSISAGVHIYTHDTVRWALSGGRQPRRVAPTRVGRCSYIGPHAVITAGVSIGEHAVVGALSFVNADVPDRTFVAGSPARPRGRVELDGTDVRIVPLGEGDAP